MDAGLDPEPSRGLSCHALPRYVVRARTLNNASATKLQCDEYEYITLLLQSREAEQFPRVQSFQLVVSSIPVAYPARILSTSDPFTRPF